MAFFKTIMPNVLAIQDQMLKATLETLYMTIVTCVIGFAIGILIGVLLVLYMPGGLKENRAVYSIVDKIVNIGRSIPFVILIALLGGFTRCLLYTSDAADE